MAHEISEFWQSATARKLGIDNEPPDDIKENLKTTFDICIAPTEEGLKARAKIHSGYRCEALNKAVGGAANSQHLTGEAFDVTFWEDGKMLPLNFVFNWMRENILFDQLILEPSWIHVSFSASGHQRGEVMIGTRGADGKMKYRKAE